MSRYQKISYAITAMRIFIFLISLSFFLGTVKFIRSRPTLVEPIPTTFKVQVLGQKTVKNCQIPLDILIDKFHGLNENHIPRDLIPVGNFQLRAEAANQFNSMVSAMGSKNLFVAIDSGYRSFEDQKKIYKPGDPISAQPGYSEHQLGTTVDLSVKYPSKEWTWLDQNAHKYGFVMSYRANQTISSGYAFEPWHWRYVGVDLATKIRHSPKLPQSFYQPTSCTN